MHTFCPPGHYCQKGYILECPSLSIYSTLDTNYKTPDCFKHCENGIFIIIN